MDEISFQIRNIIVQEFSRVVAGSGIPVLESAALPNFAGHAVALGAVGQEGARDRIRELVSNCSFTEGKDFFCVA